MTFLKAAKQVDTTAKNNGSHALQSAEITSASEVIARLIQNIETVIFGKTEVVEGCLIGLLAGGHILLEDVPGVGKTMLARSLAKSLGATYKRIQFTPDLLPSDVTGSLVFDQSSSKFHFREGPIFANIVLADEINRTSPKTQSALLECMEEGQITADLVTHLLPRPFFVIATQNPTEYEGVFPLPESQLDRFIIRLSIGYPDAQAEKELLREQRQHHPITEMESVTTAEQVLDLQTQVRRVLVDDAIYDYILRLANATREHPQLMLGLSPRGSLALARAAQAHALIRQREFVTPDDVKAIASAVVAHRIIPLPEARQNRGFTEQIVGELLQSVAVD
jgi:MoxR-like ATPase